MVSNYELLERRDKRFDAARHRLLVCLRYANESSAKKKNYDLQTPLRRPSMRDKVRFLTAVVALMLSTIRRAIRI